VLSHLGTKQAVLIIDETSFPKRGTHSAGVGWHYCGTTGQVENCQVGVFLSYATGRGHALIDRELYLPLDWCEDADQRQAAHIPEAVHFQTKPELARQMIERTSQAAVPFAWVVADSVYGGNFDLRTWLDAQGFHYVLAVPCDEPVAFHTSQGRRREEASLVETFLPEPMEWQRLSMNEGTKGPRLFDWALTPCSTNGKTMGTTFCSSVAVSPIRWRSAITSCSPQKVRPLATWLSHSGVAGRLKTITTVLKPAVAWKSGNYRKETACNAMEAIWDGAVMSRLSRMSDLAVQRWPAWHRGEGH
jgi:SRSO17 transposase